MPRMPIAAALVGLLALLIAPAAAAENATPDDTARFLAGLPPAPESPLAALTRDPGWERHAKYFNAVFDREERTRLERIRTFSKEQLGATHDTMLYMFGGPDALHAIAFFPNASTYVLSGLEPVGDVPQLTGLSRRTVRGTLQHLEGELGTLLSISFFITAQMRNGLHTGPVSGTLPIVYVFLARSGKTILDTSFVELDDKGAVRAMNEAHVKRATRGFKIDFKAGEGPTQTLYYFSTNLANDGVRSSGFLAFCDKLGVADSFVKSASYLMHGGGFSAVRDFLLDHSATILQDDSGIPLRYFDHQKWQLQPLGRYDGPIPIFAGRYQPQLAALFRKGHPIPLGFGLGYRWRLNDSNLLLARRIAEPKPD
jgi:hypothetical protein